MRSYFLSSGQELCSQNPLSQAGEFSSGCIVSPQTLCAAAPAAAPVGHPSLAGDKAVPWLCARSGVCGFRWRFFFKRCTIFRRRWTALARGQRQPSPCQEARCMVTLPGSPWQGWESFSRCDQTACGSRRSRAACLRGTTTLCHQSPCTANVPSATPKTLGAGCCSSLGHAPLGWALRDGFGARSSSRVERLFPLPSSPAGAFHLLSNVVARAEPHSQQTAVTDGRS